MRISEGEIFFKRRRNLVPIATEEESAYANMVVTFAKGKKGKM